MGDNGVISGPAASLDTGLGRLVDELTARLRSGEAVDPAALAAEFPGYAEQLQRLLPAMALLADVSRSAGRSAEGIGTPREDADPVTGTLGDYRIVCEVGRGGMGVVYEAEQVSLGRRVALKVLPFASTMDAKQLQRFKNEARAAASLHHEHIVPVHAVGCERGVHFYAMQLIDGKSLAVLIRQLRGEPASSGGASQNQKGGSIECNGSPVPGDVTASYPGTAPPTEEVAAVATQASRKDRGHYRGIAEIISQAADALEHAHTLGIVHRDVKPGNLILDDAGHLWVTDFGLARFGSDADLTMTGDLLGTLRYMSPEQALAKHGLVDHRTDVYSLGATLYELLTLRPAMDGADKQEILKKIAFEEPPAPRSVDRAIPEELETITLKALAKEPAERYATAGELAGDLRRWLGHLTIKARPPGLRQRLAKWARRHPGVAATAGVSAALLLGLVIAGLAVNNSLLKQEEKRTSDALNLSVESERHTQAALDLAFQSARQTLSEIADAIGDVPRLEETQRKVVQSAVAIYERLADYKGNAPEVERERGLAQFRLGMIHDRLGDLKKGGDAYTRAADIFRRLAAREPHNADYRYWQARSLAEHGDLCDRQGNGEEAETLARQGYDLIRQAAIDFPNDSLVRAGLADCCLVLGSVNFLPGLHLYFEFQPDDSPGRWKECEDLLRHALKLYPSVIENAPEQIEYRWRFHRAQRVLSQMPKLKFQEAVRLAEASVAGYEALANADPRKQQPRAGLCDALVWRGRLLFVGVPGGLAERQFREARRIADELVQQYPNVPYYRTLQAGTRFALGWLLVFADRLEEARPLLELAAGYKDESPDGHVPPWQIAWQAARSNQILGIVYEQTGRLDEAENAIRQALALDMQTLSDYPNSGSCSSLSWTTKQITSLLSRRGSSDKGIAVNCAHIEFWKAQAARYPANPLVLRAYGWALNDLGDFLQTLGEWEKADRAYGEALDAHDKLERSGLLNPSSKRHWSGLDRAGWTSLQKKRAWLYAKAGRADDAAKAEKAYYEIVQRAFGQLEATPPGTLAQRTEVRLAMQDFAQFLKTIGRRDESIAAYDDAIDQLDQWRDDFPTEPHAEYAANFRIQKAFVLQTVGKAAEANRAADEAITIERNLAASGKPMPRRWLAWHLGSQALIRWRTGRVDEAASIWSEALEVIERLAAEPSPTGAVQYWYKSTLPDLTSRHASFLEQTGQLKEAEAAYLKTVRLYRGLAEGATPGEWYRSDDPRAPYEYLRAREDWHYSLIRLTWFYVRRGNAEQAASTCAAARDVYEEYVAAWPRDDSGRNNLAWFLVTCPVETLRDPARAVRLARSSLVRGELSTFLATLGAAQYRAGEFQAAVANLDRATRLEEKRPHTGNQLFRAMAHWRVGKTDAALRYYEEAVRGQEWPNDGDDALRMLREEAAALLGVK
jgi:serine/threonine protein kinase/Flp pilus assembly protein TadD